MRLARTALFVVSSMIAVAAACTSPRPADRVASKTALPAISATVPPAPDASPPDAGATTTAGGAPQVTQLTYLADGTLVVATTSALVTVARDGTVARFPLPAESTPWLTTESRAAIVELATEVRLVTLSPLREVYAHAGHAFGSAWPPVDSVAESANDDHDKPLAAVTLSKDGARALRLLPPPGIAGPPVTVDIAPTKDFAVVTFEKDDPAHQAQGNGDVALRAFTYDLTNGRRVATAPSNRAANAAAQVRELTFDGNQLIAVHGTSLERVDLATGKVLKKASFACKDAQMGFVVTGQPMLDPTGRRLLVTCNMDGVILDAHTFARERVLKTLVPGCDNGFDLAGHWKDAAVFVVEGCSGESRIDTRTGRYVCGDDPHLMGEPYEIAPPPQPTAPPPASTATVAPACHAHANGASSHDGYGEPISASYEVVTSDDGATRTLVGPGTRVPLVEGDGTVAIDASERRAALVRGTHVVELALPGGAVARDVPL